MRASFREMRNEYHPKTLAGPRGLAGSVLRRAAVGRQRGPPAGAAVAHGRRHQRRPDAVHQGRHGGRPPGVAEHRRPATGIHLGPRCAAGAGLERRLAASRSHRHAGTALARPGAGSVRLARCAPAGGPESAGAGRVAHQHLRRGQQHHHRLGAARARDGSRRGALHEPVRQRPGHAQAARRLCHAREHRRRDGTSARGHRVLLVDQLGRRHAAPERGDELHPELAVRAARRQRADLDQLPVVGLQHPVHDLRHRPARLASRAPGEP